VANPHQSASVMKVENAVKVEPVGEFELKGIRRPLAGYNVIAALFEVSVHSSERQAMYRRRTQPAEPASSSRCVHIAAQPLLRELTAQCVVDEGEGPRKQINPALSACEARLATSSRLLAAFVADCATVASPQMRETERLSRCSHSPTLLPGTAARPSLARPLYHRVEMPK
jgi:hypothetical protein